VCNKCGLVRVDSITHRPKETVVEQPLPTLVIVLIFCSLPLIFVGLSTFVARQSRTSRGRSDRLWPSLSRIVAGTARGTTLRGRYRGMELRATISEWDRWGLTLTIPAHGGNWRAAFDRERVQQSGDNGWVIEADHPALKQQLEQAGVRALLQQQPFRPTISYNASSGTLRYDLPIGDRYDLPTPAEFTAQLELLARLAEINTRVNPPR
jgi:hypothetical protein